ncbi:hypothetical protein BU26DRAFT_513705 [Trematosphaeria pertusa]|uniref:Mus7/MMS22 family-domain-containing protein n=1 Tax=Trematosphaeria pertusa TaxID=390896 RepID=A0A6A6J2A0_9PLEO|nr:uncharacterized protein BU26DRAFT_513705 [Trematosphaeria pertusa]KAF2256975.1 hypothetical protein BU26DRAFT_513705 [Trematosphaeria pertusa]
MSKWRLKGFVQDSDGEDEDIESLSTNSTRESQNASSRRVEHGDTKSKTAEKDAHAEEEPEQRARGRERLNEYQVFIPRSTSATRPPLERSPLSPMTPTAAATPPLQSSRPDPATEYERQQVESPDPLQSSPPPKTQRIGKLLSSSQSLGYPNLARSTPAEHGEDVENAPTADCLLAEFGISPLSDSSQSDVLSDPPSDIEEHPMPTIGPSTVFASPKCRTTVQVVIPPSTAAQRVTAEQAIRRALRARKPEQLHPYLIEAERYRQECQRRGIKPVPRDRSPPRKSGHNDQETQEQEFDPENDAPPSSPPEIPVSTPDIRMPRKDGYRNSAHRSTSGSARRRSVPAETRSSDSVKRRKIERPLTQATAPRGRTVGGQGDAVSDIWAIPQSPPYSSSPPVNGASSTLRRLARPLPTTPIPDLLTPSHSSTPPEHVSPAAESDAEPVVRSVHRPAAQLRPTITIPSDSPSGSSSSDSESEPSEAEMRQVGKRIRGVLPASWLRIDRQAQEKRNAQARGRLNATQSPEKVGPQRGVAKKITKHSSTVQRIPEPSDRTRDVVVLSDDFEIDSDIPLDCQRDVQRSAQAASDLAAIFDSRYADDDSENMENDRLDLFAGASRKRKRQTKLTDSFAKIQKEARVSNTGTKIPDTSAASRPRALGRSKCTGPRIGRRTLAPALSVLDLDQSPSNQDRSVPQFLRLAKRQARRRADYARQRPTNKHIRLHRARDTEDATLTLHQWRSGVLKPKANVGRPKLPQPNEERQPLSDIVDNQQHALEQQGTKGASLLKAQDHQTSRRQVHRTQSRRDLPPGLLVFRRHSPSSPKSPEEPASSKPIGTINQFVPRRSLPFRTAQLEGSETGFSRSDRRIAFQKGLQQVDKQFNLPLPVTQRLQNPQLARFLADEDAVLPPLPSAKDVGEHGEVSSIEKLPARKRRLIRKVRPQRIDADSREYRQPSEPALQDLFKDRPLVQNHQTQQGEEQNQLNQPVLQGLGPYGTRYPTTFDLSPLKVGTYFHSSTFIGSGELHLALQLGATGTRDLDEPAGYWTIHHNAATFKCGPWNDETFSQVTDLIDAIWLPLDDHCLRDGDLATTQQTVFKDASKVLRSLIGYMSMRLSFLDSVDRQAFTSRMKQFIESLFNRLLAADAMSSEENPASGNQLECLRAITYLLTLTSQIRQIAQHSLVEFTIRRELSNVMANMSKHIVMQLLRRVPQLSDFLERNKQYKERENGIQHSDIVIESLVVCMHVLARAGIHGLSFWDLVSQGLSPQAEQGVHLKDFESLWGTLFTLLPFVELDESGVFIVNRRSYPQSDNWALVRDLLKRLFILYPSTYRAHSSSLNDYIRTILTRCHVLLQSWNWKRCDTALNAVFDFFAKNGLRQLRREESSGSVQFLENLAGQPSLAVGSNDNSFHIFLKCLALGLQGLRHLYAEKKFRSIVFRLTPNHGRSYPKDQRLEPESLDALRNHHDLLCTLYWTSPPSCRPKLDLIRGLVHHQNSHREACKLNVRAWTNLAAFQLSTEEPYASARPFAEWHKEITEQTLKQYRLAKTEVEDYLKSGALGETSTNSLMVRQTIEKNQEQAIATLRDCIAGIQKAIETNPSQGFLKDFLIDSGLVQLLELPHLEDPRLVVVIRDTLRVLRVYANLWKRPSSVSQQSSEDSQDYGDFPDLDDFHIIEQQPIMSPPKQTPLDFIQTPLWHLLSNAFGAEYSPDDNLLTDSVDTWALVAGLQVSLGRSWSFYIDSFSQVSWQQLRRTEQTRKFGPYFMAAFIACDPVAYEEHRHEFLTRLLLSLVDRESMLRFQHRLLHAIARVDSAHPLMRNPPFFRDVRTGNLDITADTLRARRLALISSLLANMRDDRHNTLLEDPGRAKQLEQEYAAMLKAFMTAMKDNYKELRQGTMATGAYVEFVQKIVQFLQQYTSDICPVDDFFTKSPAFPLPATDPTYVVGRLCGYAPKLSDGGVAKQLAVFVQTVAQQAASENDQSYLVNQLKTALCTDEAPAKDRMALRRVLLQGIFPVYIEAAFSSITEFLIARPLLQSLKSVLNTMMLDLRIMNDNNVQDIYGSIIAVSHAFIRSTEQLKGNALLFQQPYILHTVTLVLEAMAPIISLLDYIHARCSSSTSKPVVTAYFEQINVLVAQMACGMIPQSIPSYNGDAHCVQFTYPDLLAYCARELRSDIKKNWSTNADHIFFGHGHMRREVLADLGGVEEEKARLVSAVRTFHGNLAAVYGEEHREENMDGSGFLGDVDV